MVHRVDVLGDPGNQRLRLEDDLISVAALDRFSVNQAADGQAVRICRGNDTGYLQALKRL